jgi:hypothetical protein
VVLEAISQDFTEYKKGVWKFAPWGSREMVVFIEVYFFLTPSTILCYHYFVYNLGLEAYNSQAYARAINPRIKAGSPWSWHVTTPGLLFHAVKEQGWGFIPNQVLPPMLANVTYVLSRFSLITY